MTGWLVDGFRSVLTQAIEPGAGLQPDDGGAAGSHRERLTRLRVRVSEERMAWTWPQQEQLSG
jgi:hypothetical protein